MKAKLNKTLNWLLHEWPCPLHYCLRQSLMSYPILSKRVSKTERRERNFIQSKLPAERSLSHNSASFIWGIHSAEQIRFWGICRNQCLYWQQQTDNTTGYNRALRSGVLLYTAAGIQRFSPGDHDSLIKYSYRQHRKYEQEHKVSLKLSCLPAQAPFHVSLTEKAECCLTHNVPNFPLFLSPPCLVS